MSRVIAVCMVAGPLLMVIVGLGIIVSTPNVITEKVSYEYSHTEAQMLAMLGGILSVITGLVASEIWND